MANCVTKYFTKKGTFFTETERVVIAAKITDKVTWDFYSGGQFTGFDGGVPYAVGTWRCDGDENFMITGMVTGTDGKRKNKTFSSKTPNSWTDTVVSPTTQRNPIFNCIRNFHSDNKDYYGTQEKLFEYPDRLTITYKKENITHIRSFYTNKRLIAFIKNDDNKLVVEYRGNWYCVGERDYGRKIDITPATAEPVEPTYDKSKFPLGIGSEGPEVAQLQNYLNRLIPNEPLVVNGVFDVKTADKLKHLQKSLNINK